MKMTGRQRKQKEKKNKTSDALKKTYAEIAKVLYNVLYFYLIVKTRCR